MKTFMSGDQAEAPDERSAYEQPPMRLYRYVSISSPRGMERLAQVVVHNQARLSSPVEFNDPFDCLPQIDMPKTRVKWDLLGRRWVEHLRRQFGDATARDAEAALKRLRPSERAKRLEYGLRKAAETVGVYCLSERNDSVLMWSHYADNHRGVCLAFDLTRPPISDMHLVRKVVYQDNRPRVPALSGKDEPGSSIDALWVKAKSWEYEQEWRVLLDEGRGKSISFPPQVLVGIVFGARCSPNDHAGVMGLVRESRSPISLFEARVSDSRFKLDIVPA